LALQCPHPQPSFQIGWQNGEVCHSYNQAFVQYSICIAIGVDNLVFLEAIFPESGEEMILPLSFFVMAWMEPTREDALLSYMTSCVD
jgi:hypothetical protein